MQNEVISTKKDNLPKDTNLEESSVCVTQEESQRLFKLLEIFISIDKRLKEEIYEETNKRSTDSSSKA